MLSIKELEVIIHKSMQNVPDNDLDISTQCLRLMTEAEKLYHLMKNPEVRPLQEYYNFTKLLAATK